MLDKHASRLILGNQPVAEEIAPEYQTSQKCPTLFNLIKSNQSHILSQRGINLKIASGNYHRELGLSERVVYKAFTL